MWNISSLINFLFVIPTSLVVMVLFYFNNRYFDKKRCKETAGWHIAGVKCDCNLISRKPDVPLAFALLPVLPLALLIFFSPFVGLFQPYCNIGYHYCYMLFSLFLSLVFVLFHTRSVRTTFNVFAKFWKGMGNVFTSVVTLIVASEVFSKGLIGLGFIDSLVGYSSSYRTFGISYCRNLYSHYFWSCHADGKWQCSLFSFGPLLPDIATQLGLPVFFIDTSFAVGGKHGCRISLPESLLPLRGSRCSSVELARRNTFPFFNRRNCFS